MVTMGAGLGFLLQLGGIGIGASILSGILESNNHKQLASIVRIAGYLVMGFIVFEEALNLFDLIRRGFGV